MKKIGPKYLVGVTLCVALFVLPVGVPALEVQRFDVAGGDGDLREELLDASLVATRASEGDAPARDVLAAAQADYTRFLRVLYANGYYGGVIKISLDGREAAGISTFSAPPRFKTARVQITPGRQFRFDRAEVTPLPQGSTPPDGFRAGAVARSEVLQETVDGAVSDWRDKGHAKVRIADQNLRANHASSTLSAQLRLAPGPVVKFGNLRQTTPSAVRAERIQEIADLPRGEVFSPAEKKKAAERLRRTGAFSSVSLTEAETLGPGNTMDINLALADEKPRRFGFGAEISSLEGLTLSGFWLHRNLFGGAERFRIGAEVGGIAGQSGGVDYSLDARLDFPAAIRSDMTGYVVAALSYEDEPTYREWISEVGIGLVRHYSDTLEFELGVGLRYSETDDSFGDRRFFFLTLPGAVTWDNRNDKLDPTKGYYLRAEATPFVSVDGNGGGMRFEADGRAYRNIGGDRDLVLAGRVQLGSVVGASLANLPPDYLFYSGGGGTVRGQPYQSLGVDLGGGSITGGRSFLAVSTEVRAAVTDTIGLVGFVDAGYVGANGLFEGAGEWHAGAGVGLRYDTGIGPVRLDVAAPIGGATGDGVQIYVGIGQAF
ncbi:autotransporter assembly complex protein TamA [Rhodobacteraceae bacterium D3-12]|nr:autotransporter assembly complex protein TamA [Rhodobacteraceae bacterium D3-12]